MDNFHIHTIHAQAHLRSSQRRDRWTAEPPRRGTICVGRRRIRWTRGAAPGQSRLGGRRQRRSHRPRRRPTTNTDRNNAPNPLRCFKVFRLACEIWEESWLTALLLVEIDPSESRRPEINGQIYQGHFSTHFFFFYIFLNKTVESDQRRMSHHAETSECRCQIWAYVANRRTQLCKVCVWVCVCVWTCFATVCPIVWWQVCDNVALRQVSTDFVYKLRKFKNTTYAFVSSSRRTLQPDLSKPHRPTPPPPGPLCPDCRLKMKIQNSSTWGLKESRESMCNREGISGDSDSDSHFWGVHLQDREAQYCYCL